MNEFKPLNPSTEKLTYWEGFQTHMFLAFREFDLNYYETYVFTIVISGTLLWAFATLLQWLWNCRNEAGKKENQALALLKDDLIKSGPYKRDRSGMPTQESIIKLHAVIFKHAQKKIIEREIDYQKRRLQYIKEKDMIPFKSLVRRSYFEYQQIEDYVRGKALGLMNLELNLYNYAFTKAL